MASFTVTSTWGEVPSSPDIAPVTRDPSSADASPSSKDTTRRRPSEAARSRAARNRLVDSRSPLAASKISRAASSKAASWPDGARSVYRSLSRIRTTLSLVRVTDETGTAPMPSSR